MFDVIGHKRWFFLVSAILTIPGLIFILLTPLTNGEKGLQFSIDYTGGTEWQIHFAGTGPETATVDGVKLVLAENGLPDAVVTQNPTTGVFTIKTPPIGLATPPPSPTPAKTLTPSQIASIIASPGASDVAAALGKRITGSAGPTPVSSAAAISSLQPSTSPGASPSPSPSASPSASPTPTPSPSGIGIPTEGVLGAVATDLQAKFGPIDSQPLLTTIGPVVSSDLIAQAFTLILVGALGILLWITFRFHDVKFGFAALASLIHDVLVVVGTFAILGTLFGVEIDALFVTAMLTVIGFSVHDTIVVFDRIRENKARHAGEPFAAIVNHSILQTFGRSINTSLTVVFTLVALLLFGGVAIRYFVLALLIGIVSGTYSSIFNASPILVVWQEWEERRKARAQATRPSRRATA